MKKNQRPSDTMVHRLLLVDMDGVLCDYNGRLFAKGLLRPNQLIEEKWNDCALSPQLKKRIRAAVDRKGFFARLKPIQNAIDSVEELLALNWNVFVCSKPPRNRFGWSEKWEWIQRFCPSLGRRIILTTSKAAVRGDVFIDDSLPSLQEWSGGQKILLQTNQYLRYNNVPSDVLHFTAWPDLIDYLQSHASNK
jgi:5'(3')-deoxyribonucleotidase